MRARCFDTLVCAAVMETLSKLDTLTSVSFGFLPEPLVLPEMPTFKYTHHLSLFVYSIWGRQPPQIKHSDLVSTNANILTKFPVVQSLAVHHHGTYEDDDNNVFTIRDMFTQCSPERPPPLKELDLMNVPLQIDHHMAPFFTSLETLSTEFTSRLNSSATCGGALPVIDDNGSTTLRTLQLLPQQRIQDHPTSWSTAPISRGYEQKIRRGDTIHARKP